MTRRRQPRDAAQILAEVDALSTQVRDTTASLNELLERRRALYLEARELDPPVSYGKLAKAAGVTEGAVMQVVKKGQSE